MRSPRPARAYRTHRAARAQQPPRPGHLTTNTQAPDTGIRLLRAQVGIHNRGTTNIQAPNTAEINRARAMKDMDSRDTKADREQRENRAQAKQDQGIADIGEWNPLIVRDAPGTRNALGTRPSRAARPRHPLQITQLGPRVQPTPPLVPPRRSTRAKPTLPRPRRPAPPYQPCRGLRRPQSQHPRLRHPRQPRLRRQRRHNSPGHRARRSPAPRRMPRGAVSTLAAATPGGIQPRSRPPWVRSLPWRGSRPGSHTLRALAVRRERRMARRRPADARRRS